MFSAIAPRYDLLNHLLSFQADRLWRRQAVQLLCGKNKILDLCAGTLDLSIALAKQSPNTSIDAVDFSEEMLDLGRSKLTDGLSDRIKTHSADIQKLPFKDKSYDGAMVAYGMRNVDDNQRALTEILRVLRPGAKFVILDFFKPSHVAAKLFHVTYGRFVVPFLGGLISGNRQAYRYLRDSIRGFYTAEDYESLMNRCGFQNVTFKHQWGGASTLFIGAKK
jgi:demethylmenaquinone methyltransferase/2-methoxy-6-polyprenyl-1,4-benzoquinol methylase